MPDPTLPAAGQHRHRGRRIADRIGWLLLTVINFCVSYVLLVAGGR